MAKETAKNDGREGWIRRIFGSGGSVASTGAEMAQEQRDAQTKYAFRTIKRPYMNHPVTFDMGGVKDVTYSKAQQSDVLESVMYSGDSNPMAILRPGGGKHINPEKAMANNNGFVYAAVNAKGREIMSIDWRLYQVNGKNHVEKHEHELLDLLDGVNPYLTGPELKYLTSAHLDLVGNSYWLLTDKKGNAVKTALQRPDAIWPLDPSKTRPVLDTTSFPFRIKEYVLQFGTSKYTFPPEAIVHFRLPDPENFYEGVGIVQKGDKYIDLDNYVYDFMRKFFVNGARPAGFLKTEFTAPSQLESVKLGFMEIHEGIDNMNKIAVLPKDVTWQEAGANMKELNITDIGDASRDRILSLFGVSKTILGTAESDTNRACYDSLTEVLTENGWKKYWEVQDGERIAEFDGRRNVVRFAAPIAKYVYEYKGEMVHFENSKMDIMVTPDHRMWYRPDHKGADYRITTAEKIPKVCHVMAAAPQTGGDEVDTFTLPFYEKGSHPEKGPRVFNMDDWLEFLGYVISEGGVSSQVRNRVITLYQKKHPHVDKMRACLKRLKESGSLNYGEYQDKQEGGTRFNVYGAPIVFWMHDNIGSYAGEKYLPDFVFKLHYRQRRILFDALMLGDGSIDPRDNRKCGYYSTTSHQLADDVQRLAFSLGIQSHNAVHYEAEGNRSTCYRVIMDFGNAEQQIDFQHRNMREVVDYDGYVWCFRTSTGLFVTRRNGKIALQGNTAETADYVFSKRVVKPHMQLICSFLNEQLVPRYGDNLYITFIDPVPEDKAARTDEMKTAVGSQPVITVNEARENFMGLGPVDGGDRLMAPNNFAAVDEPKPAAAPEGNGGKPVGQPVGEEDGQSVGKKLEKAVAFRPARAKLRTQARERSTIVKRYGDAVAKKLEEMIGKSKKARMRDGDDAFVRGAQERQPEYEKPIAEAVAKVNADQKAVVEKNLPKAARKSKYTLRKAVDPAKLFDLDEWIRITIDAVTPAMAKILEAEGAEAAAQLGATFDSADAVAGALAASVKKLAESYQTTARDTLAAKLDEGLEAGQSMDQLTDTVSSVYGDLDDYAAKRVARTESWRAINQGRVAAYQQAGVKTMKWETSGQANVCPFCASLNGTVIPVDGSFVGDGESFEVDGQTYTADYGAVVAGNLHPNCSCTVVPEDMSLE